MGDRLTSDVIVVGHGVLALSIAVQLARKDKSAKVSLVGDTSMPGGASKAAGAMLGSFGEITNTSLDSKAGQKKFKMSLKATDLWPDLLDYLSDQSGRLVKLNLGTYVFANSRSGLLEDENIKAMRKALDVHNETYEVVPPNDVSFFLPEEDSRARELIYIPHEGSVDGGEHLAALAAVVSSLENITVKADRVVSVQVDNGSACGVILQSRDFISTKCVVLANGVGVGHLIQTVDVLKDLFPPIFAGMGTSLVVAQPEQKIDSVVRTPNRAFACGFHAVPRSGEHLYLGATNNVHLDRVENPSISDMHFLMECAMEQLNHTMHGGSVYASSVGNRPVSLDTFPLLGKTHVEGLVVATGTYRDGFHLSPLIAEAIADLVIEGIEAPELEFFSATRSYIQAYELSEAIEQTIKYYSSVGYEHGLKIPKVGWHEMFGDYFREKAVTLYDELETDLILHPDLFSLIDQDREKMIPLFRDHFRRAKLGSMGN